MTARVATPSKTPPAHLAGRARRRGARSSGQSAQRPLQLLRLSIGGCVRNVGQGHIIQLGGQLGKAAACHLVHINLQGGASRAGRVMRSTGCIQYQLQQALLCSFRMLAAVRKAPHPAALRHTCSSAVRESAMRFKNSCLPMPRRAPLLSVSTRTAICGAAVTAGSGRGWCAEHGQAAAGGWHAAAAHGKHAAHAA